LEARYLNIAIAVGDIFESKEFCITVAVGSPFERKMLTHYNWCLGLL